MGPGASSTPGRRVHSTGPPAAPVILGAATGAVEAHGVITATDECERPARKRGTSDSPADLRPVPMLGGEKPVPPASLTT